MAALNNDGGQEEATTTADVQHYKLDDMCNGRFWMPYIIPLKLLFLKLGSFRVFLCFHTYVSSLRISCPQRIRMYNGVYKLNRCLNKD
jgi:hypothetical protein